MDVIIFSGQSNMQGSTGSFPVENPPVEKAWEYRFLTNSLLPLQHPVGEDIGEKLLDRAAEGNGSLVPDFCRQYVKKTGREVVAIHVAKGGSSFDSWQKGTERFSAMLEKVKAGIEKAKEIGSVQKIFLVWLQGESDAIAKTGTKNYLKMLVDFKNAVKAEISLDKFGIIKVGRFSEFAEWVGRPAEEKRKDDEEIMQAQELAPETDGDFCVLTRICPKLSVKKKYLNEKEHGPHYNDAAMKIIGKKAANGLVKAVKKSF